MPDTATTIYSDTPDMDTLGGRLSRARDATGMSVSELARRIGVQSSTLKAWESDRSQPRANRLPTLAGILNVSLSWLLYGVGVPPKEDSVAEVSEAFSQQLDRLKRLQAESAEVVALLESELQRIVRRD